LISIFLICLSWIGTLQRSCGDIPQEHTVSIRRAEQASAINSCSLNGPSVVLYIYIMSPRQHLNSRCESQRLPFPAVTLPSGYLSDYSPQATFTADTSYFFYCWNTTTFWVRRQSWQQTWQQSWPQSCAGVTL